MGKLPMICYLYDEETGVYLNQSAEAREDPKQRGVFDVPVNATLEPPPSVPDPRRQVAVYRDGEWHIERKASAPMTDDEKKAPTKKVRATTDVEPRR